MVGRVRLEDVDVETVEEEEGELSGGQYFARQKSSLTFIPSGSALLDCVLGGGWAMSRISNVVGSPSSGKTLLAMEGQSNFLKKFRNGLAFYRESEDAFDEDYAAALGIPIDRIERTEPESFETIEDWFDDLNECIERCRKSGEPGFYVVDSLDALTDKEEQKRKFGEGSFGTEKPKQIGKLLRMKKGDIARANMHVMVISQTRDKIGSMFPQQTRSGGKALDFYASQILWLSSGQDVEITRKGIKRSIGVRTAAKCTKNKAGVAHRKCDFIIKYGHGIDTLNTNLEWLEDYKLDKDVLGCTVDTFKKHLKEMSDDDYWNAVDDLDEKMVKIWQEVEEIFLTETRAKRR